MAKCAVYLLDADFAMYYVCMRPLNMEQRGVDDGRQTYQNVAHVQTVYVGLAQACPNNNKIKHLSAKPQPYQSLLTLPVKHRISTYKVYALDRYKYTKLIVELSRDGSTKKYSNKVTIK